MSIYSKLYEIQKKNVLLTADASNPFFNSKYVSIENIMNTLKPLLEEQGLLIYHTVYPDNVTTHIMEIGGDETDPRKCEIVSHFPLNQALDAQKKGAEITYGKRYNIVAIFALIEDDDDGNSASPSTESHRTASSTAPSKTAYVPKGKSAYPTPSRWLKEEDVSAIIRDISEKKRAMPANSDTFVKELRMSGVGLSKEVANSLQSKLVQLMGASIFHTPDISDVPF